MKMTALTLSQQLRDGNLFAEQCPSREVLKHVTSRWGVLILVALRDGTHRFSDLRRKMGGVSEKMLAQSLQALEQDGFINRVSYPVVPPHVEYSLTPLGEQVSEKVAALADWIEVNLPQVLANHTVKNEDVRHQRKRPGRACRMAQRHPAWSYLLKSN